MSDTSLPAGIDAGEIIENLDYEEMFEGTKLEGIGEEDEALVEALGRRLGELVGRRLGELVGGYLGAMLVGQLLEESDSDAESDETSDESDENESGDEDADTDEA